MVAVLKPETSPEQRAQLIKWLKGQGIDVHISEGENYTVLGLVGDTSRIDIELLESLNMVSSVKRISEPFKKANRKFHPEDSVIACGTVRIGGGVLIFMAGSGAVESEEDIHRLAHILKARGADILRANAFVTRSSPYKFEGLKGEGIGFLVDAGREAGLPVSSEITNVRDIKLFEDVDIIEVGSGNMQNTELLRELGKLQKPILLKRGMAYTIDELLMSAEFIAAGGNERIILCEQGIRSFETRTRNTLDIAAVPLLKELTHLPVIVDPSGGTGRASLVEPMAYAAAAAGADGLIIKVHEKPRAALKDGAQSVVPEQFGIIASKARKLREVLT